ncbi:MAG: hypothetical protein R2834_01375 [Rhodothermales bacterium]
MNRTLLASLMARTKNAISHKAGVFAAIMSLYWFFYAIGAWYAARFEPFMTTPGSRPTFLFGATFAVWFVSFFAAVAYHLIKNRRAERYA